MILSAPQIATLKPMLNSDRIKHLFGSYQVEPIHVFTQEFPNSRISNLHSIHEKNNAKLKIQRTLAIVDFVSKIPPLLIPAHERIIAGASIGTALVEAGWKINKNPIFFGEIPILKQVMEWMHEKEQDRAAVHIYQLEVSNESQREPVPYCTIIEIHSPQYLSLASLKALYDEDFQHCFERSDRINSLLGRVYTFFVELDDHQKSIQKIKSYAPGFSVYTSSMAAMSDAKAVSLTLPVSGVSNISKPDPIRP